MVKMNVLIFIILSFIYMPTDIPVGIFIYQIWSQMVMKNTTITILSMLFYKHNNDSHLFGINTKC